MTERVIVLACNDLRSVDHGLPMSGSTSAGFIGLPP